MCATGGPRNRRGLWDVRIQGKCVVRTEYYLYNAVLHVCIFPLGTGYIALACWLAIPFASCLCFTAHVGLMSAAIAIGTTSRSRFRSAAVHFVTVASSCQMYARFFFRLFSPVIDGKSCWHCANLKTSSLSIFLLFSPWNFLSNANEPLTQATGHELMADIQQHLYPAQTSEPALVLKPSPLSSPFHRLLFRQGRKTRGYKNSLLLLQLEVEVAFLLRNSFLCTPARENPRASSLLVAYTPLISPAVCGFGWSLFRREKTPLPQLLANTFTAFRRPVVLLAVLWQRHGRLMPGWVLYDHCLLRLLTASYWKAVAVC